MPEEAARAYADEINALFVETSAKQDTNVTALFIDISKIRSLCLCVLNFIDGVNVL